MFNVGDTLLKLATESGFAGFFANGGWQNLVMIVIACVLLYLGIVKGFEPLLLVGIAFGCLLANVSYFPGLDAVNPELNATNAMYHPELWSAFLDSTSPYYHSYGHIMSNAGLLDFFEGQGIRVIRLGLHASRSLEERLLGGAYHPAFRELCEGELLVQRLLRGLAGRVPGPVTVRLNPRDRSKFTGPHRQNLTRLAELGWQVTIREDTEIPAGQILPELE